MPKHKHAELIKAWADGAEIEFKAPQCGCKEWSLVVKPSWEPTYEYRIKPVKKSAGQVLKESYPSSVPYLHWDGLATYTKDTYEKHANAFLEAWKKENE